MFRITNLIGPRHRGISVAWKITGALLGPILIFGFLAIGIVYRVVGSTIQQQIDERALVIATSLSDSVAGYVSTRDVLQLHSIVAKHSLHEGVAYALVQDRSGKVLSHSLGEFPDELNASLTSEIGLQPRKRTLVFQGKRVYATLVPILGGQVGTVHVGLWGAVFEREIQKVLFPIIGIFSGLLALGVTVSVVLSRHIIKPIVHLRSVADAMSKGNLDAPVGIGSRDEIGDLARSLERMRASLKAAMARLSRATQIKDADERSGKSGQSTTKVKPAAA